jgi:hypothetical protein
MKDWTSHYINNDFGFYAHSNGDHFHVVLDETTQDTYYNYLLIKDGFLFEISFYDEEYTECLARCRALGERSKDREYKTISCDGLEDGLNKGLALRSAS